MTLDIDLVTNTGIISGPMKAPDHNCVAPPNSEQYFAWLQILLQAFFAFILDLSTFFRHNYQNDLVN